MLDDVEKAKILVVDDEAVNIQLLNEVLKGVYRVYFAPNGFRALEVAELERPDLILLDIMMPGMDGYEVCTRLKSDPQTANIPVLFITALAEEGDEARGFEVGAVDYITKPVRPAIVRARVKTHLELKHQRDILAQLSMRDGLTGIANRRRLDESLERECRRANRSRKPLGLIMLDIDHFKLFNDNYGHAAGDECLRQVAMGIARSLERPADLVARYGGEEFVCVLPETGEEGVRVTTSNIRRRIAELAIPHAHSPVAPVVTVSMGAVFGHPGSAPGLTAAQLLGQADALLYEAKRLGRNQACFQELATAEGQG